MSIYLINCSNLKAGGGLQVADSICGQLEKYQQHKFVVVLSKYLRCTQERICQFNSIILYEYDVKNTVKTILLGRDNFLDGLVRKHHVDAVLTVFGPSRWRPRVPHLSGFALPHLVIPESPYFRMMPLKENLKWKIWCGVRKCSLKRSADVFWTENPYISARLSKLMGMDKIFTVSNYYNQVFDHPGEWKKTITLPSYDGVTCLSVASPSSHKNFGIIEGIISYLWKVHPDFKVRFVLTFNKDQWPIDEDVREHIIYVGKVDVTECPYLYKQCDIMFMPSLLECFTATYPEAMRMERPIVTTDMEFAKGLCGDAACYYSAVDPEAAAEAIYKVATNKEYAAQLVVNGKEQLKKFDNYEQRADKLIKILEEIANETGSNT